MSSFPPLRLAVLTGLSALKDNLASLDDPACPYDDETKRHIKALLEPKVVESVVEKEVFVGTAAGRGRPSKDIRLSEEDQQMVLDEIKATLSELRSLGTGEGQLDTAAKIQIAKTKADQLERLLKMMERFNTVQKNQAFQEEVIRILDDLVSEKDRDTFLRRLEPFR